MASHNFVRPAFHLDLTAAKTVVGAAAEKLSVPSLDSAQKDYDATAQTCHRIRTRIARGNRRVVGGKCNPVRNRIARIVFAGHRSDLDLARIEVLQRKRLRRLYRATERRRVSGNGNDREI